MLGLSHNQITMLLKYACSNYEKRIPAKHETPINTESMLAHRLRRWPNTDSTPGELPVPAGMCQKEKERKVFHAWRHRGQRQTVTHVQELSIS